MLWLEKSRMDINKIKTTDLHYGSYTATAIPIPGGGGSLNLMLVLL